MGGDRAVAAPGWEAKAKETGTLRRCRGFREPGELLRVLMIHLVDGCSLRETAVRAAEGELAKVSDVALLKALRRCQEWFRWMAQGLMQRWLTQLAPGAAAGRIRVVDGSMISEPGSTGSNWRLHYSATLPSLHCDEVIVTGPEVGESFTRFTVQPGRFADRRSGFGPSQGNSPRAGCGRGRDCAAKPDQCPTGGRPGAALCPAALTCAAYTATRWATGRSPLSMTRGS